MENKTFHIYCCRSCDEPMFQTKGSVIRKTMPFVPNNIALQGHTLELIEPNGHAVCGSCGALNKSSEIFRIFNWDKCKYVRVTD